jgi:hypothetical protein
VRKKIFYIGISVFAIALILFFVSVSLYSHALSRVPIISNLTISRGGFSFAQVETGNTSLVALYAISSGKANIYLFNASTFHLWSSHMNSNSSFSGLAYARSISTSGTSVINNNTNTSQIIITTNQSTSDANSSVIGLNQFNGTAYLVIDNTKGSYSYNTTLNVSYFKLTAANYSMYNNIAITELAIILLGVAGLIITVYGALKKPQTTESEAGTGASAGEPVSKEYINSLYKNVDKGKGKKKKT